MKITYFFAASNAGGALQRNKLLPVRTDVNLHPVTCYKCNFINRSTNNFCTNCGYPIQPDANLLNAYNTRLQHRKDLRKYCRLKISYARNTLYLLAAFSMLGVTYIFADRKDAVLRGFVMLLLASLYMILGRWTLTKPFTSLLISLLLMLTFIAMNVWLELSSRFITPSAFYLLIVQIALTYFLVEGVKAAFHADILEEEFKLL